MHHTSIKIWFFYIYIYCFIGCVHQSRVEYSSAVQILAVCRKSPQLAGKVRYLESRSGKAIREGKGGNWGRGSPHSKEWPSNHNMYLSLMLAELYRLYRKLCTAGGLLSAETLDLGPIFSGSGDCPGGSERSYDTFWKRRPQSQCCGWSFLSGNETCSALWMVLTGANIRLCGLFVEAACSSAGLGQERCLDGGAAGTFPSSFAC